MATPVQRYSKLEIRQTNPKTRFSAREPGLARPGIKDAKFHGKAPYLEQRELKQQAAYLCTLLMDDNGDSSGIARYPVGQPWRNERAGLKDGDLAPGTEIKVEGEPSADVDEQLLKVERLWLDQTKYEFYPGRS